MVTEEVVNIKLWNNFVRKLNSKTFDSEKAYHEQVSEYLELIFGWDERKIEQEYLIQMGSSKKRADIVLVDMERPVVIIEMKKKTENASNDNINQLQSYMKIEDVDFGLLFANKIFVVYRHSGGIDTVSEIPLSEDSKSGQKFAAALVYSDDFIDKMRLFCEDALKLKDIENEAKEIKARILDDPNIIIDALKNYEGLSGYSDSAVEKAVRKLEITEKIDHNLTSPIMMQQDSVIKAPAEQTRSPKAKIKHKVRDYGTEYRFFNEGKVDYKARMRVEKSADGVDRFVLLKGSTICYPPLNDGGRRCYNKYSKYISNYNTINEDIVLKAPSALGVLVYGRNTNSWDSWKSIKTGESLSTEL